MAVNTKIVARLVREIIEEKTNLPYTHYIFNNETKRRYEVTITEVSTKKHESSMESMMESKNMFATGASGEPCSCCNGSGKV